MALIRGNLIYLLLSCGNPVLLMIFDWLAKQSAHILSLNLLWYILKT